MNLKKFKSEVYKSINFLKAYSVSLVLQPIYRVGQLLYRVKQKAM